MASRGLNYDLSESELDLELEDFELDTLIRGSKMSLRVGVGQNQRGMLDGFF